ncbi:alpha/beta fold hydrolase [uncultured Massilia sp.]|uniref:alpha/beta fold hydrolase n=1 Tax=uncultured Massilia sp. TaxID=169973 RepID=UPI0025E29FEE|nr:alpha/beta hydrolase [uncultured Massilia sp.]
MHTMRGAAARTGLSGLQAGLLGAGLGLAASFLYVRAKTRQAEADNPPQGRFVTVDGVRLHYIERGSGPALVLLHGNGVLANDFEHSGLLDKAGAHYRTIAFDRPGFGYSERPRGTLWTPQAQARLLHHALQRLGVESAIVVGHSWGTLVALSMALEVPDFVRGVVLLSGYYYPSMRLDAPLLAGPAIPVVGDVLRYTVSPLVGRMLWRPVTRKAFAPLPVDTRFRALSPWMALRPGQLRAAAAETALMVPAAAALARRYPELKVPATIVAGTQDRVVDFGHNSERLHERLPASELQLQPGVGHMTHYAHPDKVMAAIDAIAAQVGEPVHLRDPKAEALARASESGT